MASSKYKLTGGKKNGYAEYPKTLVEAVFWDKKKKPLEEVLEDLPGKDYVDTKVGKKMDKIVNPVSGDIVVVGNGGNAASSGKKVTDLIENPSSAGNENDVLTLDAEGKPIWSPVSSTGTPADTAMSDTSNNAIANKTVKKYVDDNFAKKNGYYGELVSGASENLVGRGSVPASYLFRTTGGTADVGTGTAQIKELKGNSLVWNQFFAGYNATKGGVVITTNKTKVTFSGECSSTDAENLVSGLTVGHKFLVLITKIVKNSGDNMNIFKDSSYSESITIGTSTDASFIYDSTTKAPSLIFQVVSGRSYDLSFDLMVFDLTLLFNGAVPDGYTAADFERDFPLGDYKNNAGEILPFLGQQIETTGVNQWDEEWESGNINPGSGIPVPSDTFIRSKNFCAVIGGQTYYAKGNLGLFFYDNNKSFISYAGVNNTTFIAPSNAGYFKLSEMATTYNNDIQIALLWSGGEIPTTYHPYEVHTLDLPISTMIGKTSPDAESEVIFGSDGMNKAGTVYDSLLVDADGYARRAVKRLRKVDMGDLSWRKENDGDKIAFKVNPTDIQKPSSNNNIVNVVCEKYVADTYDNVYNNVNDKRIGCSYTGILAVCDSAYASGTATAFQTAMDGVYLVYELATPIEYVLDTPIYLGYYANDWGTEAIKPDNTDEPYTAPCNYDVQYGMNAVDAIRNLPRNYVSINSNASDDSSLKALAGAISTALGIAITWTWSEENREYTFEIADNRAFKLVSVPASASASGTAGNMAIDSSYLYICVATDTWKRVAIATWE